MSAPDSPEARRVLADLSPALKTLLDRQLAAGQRILWVGGAHPAPPIGSNIMLSGQVDAELPLPAGVRRRDRNSSLYSAEFTDADERYFLLTPALPPPPYPDMDAIRAAHEGPAFVEPARPTFFLPGELTVDIRGEELIFSRGGRRCSVQWFYTRGHEIHRSTLSDWFDPETRRTIPMTPAEADEVFQTIVAHARIKLGTSQITIQP